MNYLLLCSSRAGTFRCRNLLPKNSQRNAIIYSSERALACAGIAPESRPRKYFMHYSRTAIASLMIGSLDRFPVERMVQKWAPLVWLAPGEKFFPTEVSEFLRYVTVRARNTEFQNLPIGPKSEEMFLVTKSNIGNYEMDSFPAWVEGGNTCWQR